MAAIVSRFTPVADTTNVNTYTTGSFTPTAGDLLFVFTHATASIEPAVSHTCTASANGITFTQVARLEQTLSGHVSFIYVANQLVPASPAAMTVSSNFTTDAGTGCFIAVGAVTGMTRTGLSAIKQTALSPNLAAAAAYTATFGVATLTGNPLAGFIATAGAQAITPPASWTELAEPTDQTLPAQGFEWAEVDSGQTSTAYTWTRTAGGSPASNIRANVAAVEFDASAAAAAAVFPASPVRRVMRPPVARHPRVADAVASQAGAPQGRRRAGRVVVAARPRRIVAVVPAQVVATPPPYVPETRRRLVRVLAVRRGRSVEVVPPQVVAPLAPYVPETRRRVVRALVGARRGHSVGVTPHQAIAPRDTRRRVSIRGFVPRRRAAEVVPPQIAVAAPPYVPEARRRAVRGRVARRRSRVEVVPPQVVAPLAPYVPTVPPKHVLRGAPRRGRRAEVIPTQTAPVALPYVPAVPPKHVLRGAPRRARIVAVPHTPTPAHRGQPRRPIRGLVRRVGHAVVGTFGTVAQPTDTSGTAALYTPGVPTGAAYDAATGDHAATYAAQVPTAANSAAGGDTATNYPAQGPTARRG